MNKKKYTKMALALSVVLMIAWSILGTSASIAWFTDATPAVKNSFVVGQIDLDVWYKNDIRDEYTEMTAETPLFNDKALYEPNYTQVVYLRVENNGDIDFKYRFSVDVVSFKDSMNILGWSFHLPEYLRYGVVFGDSEEELTRQLAQFYAQREVLELVGLNQYSKVDDVVVSPGDERYVALIVYMPWDVGNEANHMIGFDAPEVHLGVTVFAQQADAPLED